MASLKLGERSKLEKLFGMSSGYVLNLSDTAFGHLFAEEVDVDIHSAKYQGGGTSKAKKLREFWQLEPDNVVGKLLHALIVYSQTVPDFVNEALSAECLHVANRLQVARPALQSLQNVAVKFDWNYLGQQLKRMEQAVDGDPDLAIGTAKELVETCCKTILAERGKPVSGAPDIPALTKSVLKELNLVPEGISSEARGGDVIRRLLQNLGTIGNGLAELRGLYGTGHGHHANTSGLETRHAKLAVGASVTLVTFLFDTHLRPQKAKSRPIQ